MRAKVIKTRSDYDAALARVEELMALDSLSDEELEELELLALLVARYEDERFPIDLPSPIAAIRFRMEQQELRPVDLVEYIGSKSKVSEVLSGKRPLSLRMIRRLVSGLGIPAEVLLLAPETAPSAKRMGKEEHSTTP